jgi:predicted PurR-regulated permease PerM
LVSNSQWGSAIVLAIWGMGVSASDNLLRPFLISSQAPVSTLAVFVGVIGGIAAFGLIGVIIGPVLLTVIAVLLRFVDASARPCRASPDIPGACQSTLSDRPDRPH